MKESRSKSFQLPGSELEHMSEAECLEMLARKRLGRIAFFAGGRQEIFPVNYGLKAGTVVLRTAPGTKLSAAPGSQVAFEIDEYDPETGAGWSVVVHGEAHDVTDAADDFSWAARGAHVTPLAPGEKTHRLAIKRMAISGRRFHRLVSEQFLG
jgi:nitroimidazol reductase NimA-like FMN-containing flavoprotein (pyridoxamine 5'-phosphate oxidase superfamily)